MFITDTQLCERRGEGGWEKEDELETMTIRPCWMVVPCPHAHAELMSGQWEYQVGPCEGIAVSDKLWVSR